MPKSLQILGLYINIDKPGVKMKQYQARKSNLVEVN